MTKRIAKLFLLIFSAAFLTVGTAVYAQSAPPANQDAAPAPPAQENPPAPPSSGHVIGRHTQRGPVRPINNFMDRGEDRAGFSPREGMRQFMPLPPAQHSYKLTLTLRTPEAGKQSTQTYNVVLNGNGAPCDLDLRSRVPISIRDGKAGGFGFEGVGFRFETHVREKSTGVELTFMMDQDSIVHSPNAERPVIRHTHFGTAAIMPEGKTITLGSFADPNGNGLVQIDATLSVLQ
ncbi:MAG: hypothetical protein ACYC46_11620 [Acidobacteriaceae bacterium]